MEHLLPFVPGDVYLCPINVNLVCRHVDKVFLSLNLHIVAGSVRRATHVLFAHGYAGSGLVATCYGLLVQTIVHGTDARSGKPVSNGLAALQRGRTGFVVVVGYVHVHSLATIASVSSPVVHYVVAQVHAFVGLRAGARTEAWHTGVVVGKQIVMIGGSAASPVAAIAMVFL